MKRRILALLLVVILLVGCAAKTNNQQTSTDNTSQKTTETATDAPKKVDFPTKAVKIIVPYSTGGGNDLTARLMADALSKELPQSVYVENLPGASGAVGWTECYNAPADGYTLTIAALPAMVLNPLSGPVNYDYTQYTYLLGTCHDPRLVVVDADSDIYTIEDLLAFAKNNRVIVGDSGATGFGHYSGVDFIDRLGITDFSFVPFSGTGDQMIAVAAGDCTIGVPGASEAKAMATAGEVRPICVMWNERIPDYPDVPTTEECGYPGLVHTSMRGFVSTPNTPDDVAQVLIEAMKRAVERDDYKKGEASIGITRYIFDADEYKRLMAEAYDNYARIVEIEKGWSK